MRLDYLAHSCFLLEHKGFRVLFDPYDPEIGYPSPKVRGADLIVVSHDHSDHNAVHTIPGRALVVRGTAARQFGDLRIEGLLARHGEEEHSCPVSLNLLSWDGFRIAHFGDLGCALSSSDKAFFKDLDLLLIPCGGGYTITPQQAAELVLELKPKTVVPMHFRTPFLDKVKYEALQSEKPFLEGCKDFAEVRFERSGTLCLKPGSPGDAGLPVVVCLQHQMG